MNTDQNPIDPYAPPLVPVEAPSFAPSSEIVLAGRGTRLSANLLDGLIWLPVTLPAIIGFAMQGESTTLKPLTIGLLGFSVIAGLALLVITLRLLATQGQTLGKKWMKVRIVRRDGSKAGFGRVFGLRMIVSGLIGAIPFVGYVYSLVNILFIFTESRECLHDKIADTKVVQA